MDGTSQDVEPVFDPRDPRASLPKIRKNICFGKFEWPFEISVEITGTAKPKIAFLSSEDRKYYPENPGHSKLAQVIVGNLSKADTPKPSYIPRPLGVSKPISNLGYGIGGLTAPRFPKTQWKNEKRPDSGTYQISHNYPPRPDICDIHNPLVAKQCKLSFGTNLTLPRFGMTSTMKPPGPGSYNADSGAGSGCTKLKMKETFGSSRCFVPTTVTICTFTAGENCSECGKEQLYDYYRTKCKVKHPNSILPGRPELVILCRKCYCRAWDDHHTHWNKTNLLWLFKKYRHCSFVHDHRNLPISITKAPANQIKKLTAKESILAKYFSDHCAPELKL